MDVPSMPSVGSWELYNFIPGGQNGTQILPHQFTSSFRGASGPGRLALDDRGFVVIGGATGLTVVDPDAEAGGGS